MDTLNIEIDNKNRDIEDLTANQEILNSQQFVKIKSSNQENNIDNSSTNTTQLDSAVFDKILSIGSILELSSFQLEIILKYKLFNLSEAI